MKLTNVKPRNAEPCAKKKLNPNRYIQRVSINWLKGTGKEKTLINFILLALMLIYFCKRLFTLKVKYFCIIKS